MHRQRHKTALERPELRQPSSPRQAENPGGTMAIKVQRTPEVESAVRKYAQEVESELRKYTQEQLIKEARFARALAQEGLELIEEGIARSQASR
jgi:hypothetical protein